MLFREFTVGSVKSIPVKVTVLSFVVFFGISTFIGRQSVQEDIFLIIELLTPATVSYPPYDSAVWFFIFGIAVGIGLYGSILLHEFGHAFVALRHGLEVDNIILYALGGVATVGIHQDPRVELKVVAAGPAVNVLLTIVFILIAVIGGFFDFAVLETYGFALALLNVFALVFNLLPILPSDGGRILQYLFALRVGYQRGTMYALFTAIGFSLAILIASILLNIIAGVLIAFLLLYETRKEHKRLTT